MSHWWPQQTVPGTAPSPSWICWPPSEPLYLQSGNWAPPFGSHRARGGRDRSWRSLPSVPLGKRGSGPFDCTSEARWVSVWRRCQPLSPQKSGFLGSRGFLHTQRRSHHLFCVSRTVSRQRLDERVVPWNQECLSLTRQAHGSDDDVIPGAAAGSRPLRIPDIKREPSLPTAFVSGLLSFSFLFKTINSLTQENTKVV